MAPVVGVAPPGDELPERAGRGYSWAVAVVGEPSSVAEAVATTAEAVGGELVWIVGLEGDVLGASGPCDVEDCSGRGKVKLGLGEGRLSRTLRLCEVPFGLGLRLLDCEMGDVKPLPPPCSSKGTGATIAIESMPSLSSKSRTRASAALSSTVGTD